MSLFDADYSDKKQKFLDVTPEKSFDYSKFLNWQTVSPVKLNGLDLQGDYKGISDHLLN